MNVHDLKQGDLVRFTSDFLRSTGQYTPPINGLVDGFVLAPGSKPYVIVFWSDASEPVLVNAGNIEPFPRTPGTVSQDFFVMKAKRDLKRFVAKAKKDGWSPKELARIVDEIPPFARPDVSAMKSKNPRKVTRHRPSATRAKVKPDFTRLANRLRK